MIEPDVMARVRAAVMEALAADATGHDFGHVERVAALARRIAEEEGADPEVCEVAAWTHDACRPWERETGLPHWGELALARIATLLREAGVPADVEARVVRCVAEHEGYAFAGAAAPVSLDSRVLQNADRLEALGATGIARAFMFAGAHGNPLGVPGGAIGAWTPEQHSGTALAHFQEKLLRLEDGMHTVTGRRLAGERTRYMRGFLGQLAREWRGET